MAGTWIGAEGGVTPGSTGAGGSGVTCGRASRPGSEGLTGFGNAGELMDAAPEGRAADDGGTGVSGNTSCGTGAVEGGILKGSESWERSGGVAGGEGMALREAVAGRVVGVVPPLGPVAH